MKHYDILVVVIAVKGCFIPSLVDHCQIILRKNKKNINESLIFLFSFNKMDFYNLQFSCWKWILFWNKDNALH